MSGAAAVRSLRPSRSVVVPEWLAEVVRPRRAPVPWPEMARAALAICVPLSVSYAAGRGSLGASFPVRLRPTRVAAHAC